eukprot:4837547-Prymnesium_polylepis.1
MPHPCFARTFTPHHCSHCSSQIKNPSQMKCMLDICITASSPSLAPALGLDARHRLVHSEATSA